MFSVARAAWMLRYFGATNVRILNGGLKKWIAENRPLAKNAPQDPISEEGDFSYSVKDPSRCILDVSHMHAVARELFHGGSNGRVQVLDARSADRFNAKVPEPRAGVRSGSIKNSINVPFNLLVNDDGTFKSELEIDAIFKARGVNYEAELINSCGSGVTACVVDLGLKLNSAANSKIYDGSWSEYGAVAEPDLNK